MEKSITNLDFVTRRWLLTGIAKSAASTWMVTAAGALALETSACGPSEASEGPVNVVDVKPAGAPSEQWPKSLAQFLEGYNQEGPNYYIPVPIHNDYGRYCTLQGNIFYIPYAGISGDAVVETDGAFSGSNHATIRNFVQRGNTVSYTVSCDAKDTDARGLICTKAPTYFRVTRVGRTGKWAQEALAGWEGSGWRDLDMTFTNKVTAGPRVDTGEADAPFYQLTDKGCLIPIEDRADFHSAKMSANPDFFFWWNVIPGNWSLADIRAAARVQRDRCPTNAAFILQWANEDPWNDGFVGVRSTYLAAFAAGHYGTATWNNPQPAIIIKADCNTGSAGNSDSPASIAGDRILYDLQGTLGRSVWKAKTIVPAGAEINENQYWTREFDQNFVRDAQRKYRTRMLYDICLIYEEEFGKERYAKQIFPCIMGQHGESGEIYNQLAVERSYIPGFFDGSSSQRVKIAGCAGYLDEADLGRSAFDFSSANGVTIEAGIRLAFTSYKARIRQFIADCSRMNVTPGFYEVAIAPVYPNVQQYRDAYANFSKTDAARLLWREFGLFWRSVCPGPVMYYDAVGDKIGSNPSTASTYYSLRLTWEDTSNPRYVGWKQGIGALATSTPA